MLWLSRLRLSGLTFLAIYVLASAVPASAQLTTGSEVRNGARATAAYTDNGTTYGPYGWNYKYVRGFDGTKLYKDVQIDFVFDAGLNYTAADKTAYQAAAKAGVEGVWNNKFVITDTATNTSYPITVNLTTAGPFDQTVQVHAGTGRDDMLNWYTGSTSVANAHEFGHMLSLYDEYIGGAVNQYPNPQLSPDGLMGLGALTAGPAMYPRYYQQYLDYMNTLNAGQSFILVPTPEPGTYAFLVSGIGAGLVFRLRRRCKA